MNKEAECYEKLLNGDSLSNEELKMLLDAFRAAYRSCALLGPRFELCANEALKRIIQLTDFTIARESKCR